MSDAVNNLIEKAARADNAGEAVQFSQAALNAAHALKDAPGPPSGAEVPEDRQAA